MKAYKKNVVTKEFVEIGTVDECGYIIFNSAFDFSNRVSDEVIDTTKLSYYYPEFYVDFEVTNGRVEKKDDEGEVIGVKRTCIATYVSHIQKREFKPKNIPQQLQTLVDSLFLEPNQYYVTGYVTEEGRAIYYDQYIKE